MEFRIAPLLIAALTLCYGLYLFIFSIEKTIQQGLLLIGLSALAFGASRSHDFYSKQFLLALFTCISIAVLLAGFILYNTIFVQ